MSVAGYDGPMRHVLRVDEPTSVFIVKTEGRGNEAGIFAFLNDILAHPQWQPGTTVILDHRNLSVVSIDADGVERVSNFFVMISPKLGGGKWALVMNEEVDFAIARAWELMTANHVDVQLRVFRSMEDALGWVGARPAGIVRSIPSE